MSVRAYQPSRRCLCHRCHGLAKFKLIRLAAGKPSDCSHTAPINPVRGAVADEEDSSSFQDSCKASQTQQASQSGSCSHGQGTDREAYGFSSKIHQAQQDRRAYIQGNFADEARGCNKKISGSGGQTDFNNKANARCEVGSHTEAHDLT